MGSAAHELSVASASGRGNFTGREGTTVEIECLKTIWVITFFKVTTNRSASSMVPCNLMPFRKNIETGILC